MHGYYKWTINCALRLGQGLSGILGGVPESVKEQAAAAGFAYARQLAAGDGGGEVATVVLPLHLICAHVHGYKFHSLTLVGGDMPVVVAAW